MWWALGIKQLTLSARERILLAAERLFALHGVHGVSLRQIAVAAGNANNSAVQYHFGSKDGLIDAIFAYRLPRLQEHRAMLISQRQPETLRELVECEMLALMNEGDSMQGHYLGFISTMRQHEMRDVFDRLPASAQSSALGFREHLDHHLVRIPEHLRSRRLDRARAFMLQMAADREFARAAGRPVDALVLEVADLTDGIVGFLEAPVSSITLRELATSGGVEQTPPLLA